MVDIAKISPELPVICSMDKQFATVDHMEGSDTIKLKKDESGQHHYIPLSWVKSVDEKGLHLDRPGKDAIAQWATSAKQ